MKDGMFHLLCFGFGFTARTLAGQLDRQRWRVTGTSRSEERCAEIRAAGFEAEVFDVSRPLSANILDRATHVLVSAPPDDAGDPVLRAHGDDIARRAGAIQWLGYLSTTGVYGDRAGGEVDERSELLPTTDRGKARLAAETGWLELWRTKKVSVHLFRLAGIYGPGRNQIVSLKRGKARRIVKSGQVFSRIHVEDIAGILQASMARPNPGSAYNVCDDEPAPPQDVVAYAAELLGVEPPPETPIEKAELSPMARSFYAESKTVRNHKIKRELGYVLKYPTYRDGLRSLI